MHRLLCSGARICFSLSLALAFSTGLGAAQQLTPQQLEQLMREREGTATSVPERVNRPTSAADWASPTGEGPRLDRTIDRTQYVLGAGDRLILGVFGYRNEIFPLTVTPEGTVVIPTVGIVNVDGLNLNEATRAARRQVLRFYPDSEVQLSLSGIRAFNIFVVGDTPEPGVQGATAVTRVSEVVPAMNEDSVLLRGTAIRRRGDTIRVDLARFRQTGDLRHNPFVREGDVIQIPIVDRTITIAGEVPYPGAYEYLPTETLAEFIGLANGGEPFFARAADTILIMRFSRDRRGEIIRIAREDAVAELGMGMRLHPFDAIYVPSLGHQMRLTEASIRGEVVRPGSYPVRPEITTIRDLVDMAGGFTPEASTQEVLLRREASQLPESTENPLATIPPEMLTPDERRILQVTSQADENNVIIDVVASPEALDMPLVDSDALLIPRKRNEVIVMGAVARPGLVTYAPGQTIDQLVARAGGYVRRADRGDVVVLRTRSGTQLERQDVSTVQPGDRIVVPYREHSTFLERVQTTQGVINTISGLVLTIVGLERLWGAITN